MESRRKTSIAILRLGIPLLVAQVGLIVTGFADTMMVGHYSTEALASASFVNNLFNMAMFACMGFSYGLTPLAGALFSRGEHRRIGATVKNAALVNLLFALLVIAVMSAVYLNLERLGQPDELLPVIRPYYLIYLAGIVPVALFNVWAQWSFAVNNTSTPMWILLGCNALNIALNWVLIYGNLGFPELGLTGAGIATLVARLLSPIILISIFMFSRRFRRFRAGFAAARISRAEFRRVNLTSWPVAMQMTFESGAFTAAAVMTGWLGKLELAAYQIVVIVGTLGFCVYYSLGSAVSVLVSNAAGLDDRGAMKRTTLVGYAIIIAFATVSSAVFAFGGYWLMSLFTDDAAVLAVATSLILPLVLYQYGDATQIAFANALRGTSRVMPMLWISFVSYVIIGLPATYLLGFTAGLGVYGIILSFSISLFTAAALFLRSFLTTIKRPM